MPKSYIEEKIFLTKHNPEWTQAIKDLMKFSNEDDEIASFEVAYRRITERTDHYLRFNSISHFQDNGKMYFRFMPCNETLMDIEIRRFDGKNYGMYRFD